MKNNASPALVVNWTITEKVLFRLVFIFILLYINSFSFPHAYIPDPGRFTSPLFELISKYLGTHILKIDYPCTYALVSDSTGMYIHTIFLLLVSAIICLVWSILDKKRADYNTLCYWFMVIIRYYLAMQLLVYGFNKIFKGQFYLPEPNTLYTRVGDMPTDLMYWTTMGVSRMYTIFCGVIEIIPALLLLFRRTVLLGTLISIGVMINVVMINFSYDISVKLYSLFLLFLSIVLAAPYTRILLGFFFGDGASTVKQWAPNYSQGKQFNLYRAGKTCIIIYLLFATLSPYIKSGNFNDDIAPRPLFHGAYTVTSFIKDGNTVNTGTNRWERVFIHRNGYLITQNMNDEMKDYALQYDTINKRLVLKRYKDTAYTFLSYKCPNDTTFTLSGIVDRDTLNILMKKINLSELLLLQKGFHWTIDY